MEGATYKAYKPCHSKRLLLVAPTPLPPGRQKEGGKLGKRSIAACIGEGITTTINGDSQYGSIQFTCYTSPKLGNNCSSYSSYSCIAFGNSTLVDSATYGFSTCGAAHAYVASYNKYPIIGAAPPRRNNHELLQRTSDGSLSIIAAILKARDRGDGTLRAHYQNMTLFQTSDLYSSWKARSIET